MQTQKPEYSYSNVLVKAGHTVPEALLLKLCTENRSVIAAGIRSKKEMEKEIFLPMEPTVEGSYAFMKKFLENTKEFTRLVSFHSMPTEFDEDVEIMPWAVLKDSKGNPLLFASIEGDFPDFIDSSADHFSESFGVLREFLGPKIEAIYNTSGNRPDKLFEYLKGSEFSKDLAEKIGHRGVISFLPITGESFAQGTNEFGVKGEWGTASSAYGYTESVTAAATPAEEVKPKAEAPAPKKGGSKYVTEEPAIPAAPIQAPANNPQEMEEVEVTHKVPTGMHGKPKKDWVRKLNNGVLVTNWRDITELKVMTKRPKTAPTAKTTPDTAIASAMKMAETNAVITMPIVAGDKQKAANDFVKKYVGDGSAIIKDPTETAEHESKLSVWHELAGLKDLSEINRYTTAFLSAYVKQHPEMAWLLICELRKDMNRMQKIIDGLVAGNVKLGDLTKTDPTITPAPDVKPLTPSPEPEAAPAKKAAGSKYV